MRRVVKGICCAWMMSLTLLCMAALPQAGHGPAQVVQDVSNQLIVALRDQKAAIAKNPQPVLYRIVKETVLPYIDVDGMVRETLGREGNIEWNNASAATHKTFEDNFIQLVVGTYSAALKNYDNETVKVFPPRGMSADATTAQVNSQILSNSGDPIHIMYAMVKINNMWKVRDFTVEGVSLINSYQAQFQSIISDKGLAGLIQTLQTHNAANGSAGN